MKKTYMRISGYEENWRELANAIVLQAVIDYRMAEVPKDLEALERFFRSEWFAALTDLDPEYLIGELRKEKMRELPQSLRDSSLREGATRGVIKGGENGSERISGTGADD